MESKDNVRKDIDYLKDVFNWDDDDDDNQRIDFLKSSEKNIIKFARKVISGEIDDEEIDEIFNEIKKKKYYTARDAIYMIKNIELTMYYIRFERTDYQTPSGEAQLYLAKFINSEGSLNYKIMISLFLTQIQISKGKNGKLYYSFHKNMRRELIEMLFGRLDSLVKMDELLAADWKNEFNNLMKSDKRFRPLAYWD